MDGNGLSAGQQTFTRTVLIHASAAEVWQALTDVEWMKKWMMADIELQIITSGRVGGPMIIRGNMGGKEFENDGTILQFEPERVLQYSHRSSLSRLPNQPQSYSTIEFELSPVGDQTNLRLTLRNFPTESIHKHLTFYWNVTLEVLKRMIEQQ
jgi:uncharacterized protein YndB with AHSA1/START domain